MAMASGNQKRLQSISQMARDLKSDADVATRVFEVIDGLIWEKEYGANRPQIVDVEIASQETSYFRHVASFAARVENDTKRIPLQLKPWLELDGELKKLQAEFTNLQAKHPNPKSP